MKYFIYARKSTDSEERQVLSIEAQLAELKEFAAKEKLEIVASLCEAKTAKEPGRTVFGEMLDRIEKGAAQGILAWHPDRLARNSIDGGRIIYLLDTGKLKDLKFPTFWFDNTPQGKFMLNIAFGQSKYYIDNLSENIKRGHRAKLRKGIWPSFAPLGYLNNHKTKGIDIDPEKAPLIRKAFELYATGEYTLKAIAKILKDAGLRSYKGKVLSVSCVQRMLKNTFYYGVFRFNGEMYDGSHEPIISKKLFDTIQQVMNNRGKKKRKRKHNFAFSGLMRCGNCGCMITAEIQKGYIYYRCTKK
jgi:site-specific DNA recombinase